jgi:hypothetical protein
LHPDNLPPVKVLAKTKELEKFFDDSVDEYLTRERAISDQMYENFVPPTKAEEIAETFLLYKDKIIKDGKLDQTALKDLLANQLPDKLNDIMTDGFLDLGKITDELRAMPETVERYQARLRQIEIEKPNVKLVEDKTKWVDGYESQDD